MFLVFVWCIIGLMVNVKVDVVGIYDLFWFVWWGIGVVILVDLIVCVCF